MKISELKLHHIGVAVPDIESAAAVYAENGWLCGEKIFDPIQNVMLCFAEKPDEVLTELVAPAAENSPVSKILQKNGGVPEAYHVCYAVADIDRAISELRAEKWLPVKPPVPACAFGGARVAFLYSKNAGLIELLETPAKNATGPDANDAKSESRDSAGTQFQPAKQSAIRNDEPGRRTKNFIFRNATLEPLFPHENVVFSGFGDISLVPDDAEKISWFYTLPPDISPREADALVTDFLQKLRLVLARVPAGTALELYRIAAPETAPIVADDTRVSDAVARFNAELEKIAAARGNATLAAPPSLGVDWRLWFLAQMPFSPAKKRRAEASVVPAVRKKCVVLDCDDTLWRGTLGEDGFDGIGVGNSYPGNAFAFFQKKLVELAESGILLTLCSRNNEADVREVFEKHPGMRLRAEHISARRINWNDKAQNVREIAAELNIGVDSLVFIDNDPRERARIRDAFAGAVAAPDFPAQPFALPEFFEKTADEFFRAASLTREDLQKTQQYRDAAQRNALSREFVSLDDYIAALKIRLCIAPADNFSLPRLAQLTQKTDQFNVATHRRSEAELRDFLARGNAVFSIAAADKIGALGIVGEAEIAFAGTTDFDGALAESAEISACGSDENPRENAAIFVNFLMSCRALGRGIETAFAQEILNRLHAAGIRTVFAEFFPTAKNAPARDFWKSLGFVEKNAKKTLWKLDLRSRKDVAPSASYQFFNDLNALENA